MKPAEIQVKINIAQREVDFWRGILTNKGCKTCTQYAMPECDKFQAAPPPDVVASGCDEWEFDGIPF